MSSTKHAWLNSVPMYVGWCVVSHGFLVIVEISTFGPLSFKIVRSGSINTRHRNPDVHPPCGIIVPIFIAGVNPYAVRIFICRALLELRMSLLSLYGNLILVIEAAIESRLQESNAFSMSSSSMYSGNFVNFAFSNAALVMNNGESVEFPFIPP